MYCQVESANKHSTAGMDYHATNTTLPTDLLKVDPTHPRRSIDAVADLELTASIRSVGVREPIQVCPNEDGTYLVIDGNRRLRAANAAELTSVPCVVNPPMQTGEIQALRYLLQHRKIAWTVEEHSKQLHKILSLPSEK